MDQVAYVRFASVYREFKDIDQFMETIQSLARDKGETLTTNVPPWCVTMPSSVTSTKRSISRKSSVSGRKPESGPRGSTRATRVAILGGGHGGKALLEIFAQDPLARLVGLAETKAETTGTELAEQLSVPVTHDYREILKMKGVDLIIDVTGSPEVEKALQRIRKPSVAIIGGASAKFMWRLIDARIRATTEIEKTLTRVPILISAVRQGGSGKRG